MPRKHAQREQEDIRLDPRLQARLEEKKARLDLHRPLAPAIVSRLEARKWNKRWHSTPAALARYEEQVQAEPRGRPPQKREGSIDF
jgi:hypothetical protein